jgi:hypothetical protein
LANNLDLTKQKRRLTTSNAKEDEAPRPTITKRSVPSSLLEDLERLTPKRTTRQTSNGDSFHRETLLAAYSGSDTDDNSRKLKRTRGVAKKPKKPKKTSRPAKTGNSGLNLGEIESDIMYRAVGTTFNDMLPFYRKLVEKIVHQLLNPTFIGKSAEFDFASQHLNQSLQATAEIKHTSSKWTSPFIQTLKAKPLMELLRVGPENSLQIRCDACRGKHKPTSILVFLGKPYDPSTFDPSTNQESVGEKAIRFYVGCTCEKKAEKSHALYHWRWSLFRTIRTKLEKENYFEEDNDNKRLAMTFKAKRKHVEEIVAAWYTDEYILGIYKNYRTLRHL